MDGTPTHRLNDYASMLIFTDALDFSDPDLRSNLPEPAALRWEITPEIAADIEAAERHFERQIGSHELRVQAYQGYGKGLIKKFKCSPDAYVQMLIQLAYHKMYGKNRPTYESAATRKFPAGPDGDDAVRVGRERGVLRRDGGPGGGARGVREAVPGGAGRARQVHLGRERWEGRGQAPVWAEEVSEAGGADPVAVCGSGIWVLVYVVPEHEPAEQ